jgi:hypothetical protein
VFFDDGMIDSINYTKPTGIQIQIVTFRESIPSGDRNNVVGWSSLTDSSAPSIVQKQTFSVYDPPEVLAQGPAVGAFADFWALGVLLYFMVIGASPWDGQSPRDI